MKSSKKEQKKSSQALEKNTEKGSRKQNNSKW
jgi:hypothetical protein